MPALKISQLPVGDTLTGAELLPIVQDQETRQTTLAAVAALASAPAGAVTNARWLAHTGHSGAFVNDPAMTVTLFELV